MEMPRKTRHHTKIHRKGGNIFGDVWDMVKSSAPALLPIALHAALAGAGKKKGCGIPKRHHAHLYIAKPTKVHSKLG